MFEFLKLLYEDEATYEKVTQLLAVNDDEKLTTAVVLNKYLNTLKVFGIKVEKSNNKYYLLDTPYKINFDKVDLKSLLMFQEALSLLPKGKFQRELNSFIENVLLRLDNKARSYLQNSPINIYKDLSFYYSQFETQILKCEKLIEDSQYIEISYFDKSKVEKALKGIPVELKYLKRRICFVVHSKFDGFNVEIPIDKIVSLKQLPTQSSNLGISTTVVYKIKDNLAKSYKLKEFEVLERKDENGDLIIINKGEDYNSLLSRLMRYDVSCEIISPKSLKEDMINLINNILSKYNG